MANEINLDSLLEEAAGGEPAPATTEEQPVEQQPVETPTEEQVTEQPTEEQSTEQPKKPNPMKEVRDKLNSEQRLRTKIEGAMQRWSDGDYKCKLRDYKTEDGKVDYDAFIQAMDKEDNENKAKTNNRSPEIQAELDRIEKEKQEIQKERLRVSMDRELASIQVSMKLSGDDINKFFKDALAAKRNPYQWLAQGGSLEDLYYILYRETIISKQVDDRIAATKTVTNTATPPTANPAKPNSTVSNSEGLSLNEMLKAANK